MLLMKNRQATAASAPQLQCAESCSGGRHGHGVQRPEQPDVATIVDRDGVVCALVFTGANRGAQWPASRVISAQKANTANALGLDSSSNSGGSGQPNGLALSHKLPAEGPDDD
jgi:hypothetical protein